MKKQSKKIKSAERGMALIVMVFFLAVLLYVGTLRMVITTGTELSNLNQEIALDYAEGFTIGLASPIKRRISDYVQNQLTQVLGQHLSNDNTAHQTARTYMCQGSIDPSAELSSQMAICDPVDFLRGLSGANNQSLDDIGLLKKYIDPSLYNTHQFQELQRQTANSFDYTLSSTFVSQEVIIPLRQAAGKTPPLPKVEQYRYLVRADIISRNYYEINTPFIINFDIVVNVNVFDSGFSGCSGISTAGIRVPSFGVTTANGTQFCSPQNGCTAIGIVNCKTDANGIVQKDSCSAGLYGSDTYKQACCNDPKDANCSKDTCSSQQACDVAGQGVKFCQVPSQPGTATFFLGGFASATEVEVGCASGATKTTSTGQKTNSGYSWNTVVRTVSLGKNYD